MAQRPKLIFLYPIAHLKSSGMLTLSPPSYYFINTLIITSFAQINLLLWINSVMIFQLQTEDDFLKLNPLTSYLILIKHNDKSIYEPEYILMLTIAILIILLMAVMILNALIKIAKKKNILSLTQKSLLHVSYLAIFCFGPLAINLLLNFILESFEKSVSNSIYFAHSVFSILFLIFLCIVVAVALKIFIPLKTKDPCSRLNNNYMMIFFLHKVALSIIYIILIRNGSILNTSIVTVLTILNFLTSSTSSFLLLKNSPFLHRRVYSLFILLQSSLLAVSSSNLIQLFKSRSMMINLSAHIYQALLIWGFSYKLMGNFRRKYESEYLGKKNTQSRLNLNFKFNLINQIKNQKNSTNTPSFRETFNDYFERLKYNFDFDQNHFLLKTAKKTSDLQLKLIVASLLLSEFDDYINAYNLSQTVLNSHVASLNLKVGALFIHSTIEKRFKKLESTDSDRKSLGEYFYYDAKLVELKVKISNFLEHYILFYKYLDENSLELLKVMQKSFKIQSRLKNCMKEWNILQEKFERVPVQILRIFYIFLTGINLPNDQFDTIRAHYILASSISSQKDSRNQQDYFKNPKVICLYSSVQQGSTGKILSISSSIRQVLGYDVKELLGKTCGILFPRYISKIYEEKLANILSTDGLATSLWKTRSFLTTKVGDLISCETISMISCESDRNLCLGTLIVPDKVQSEVFLANEAGRIFACPSSLKILMSMDIEIDFNNFGRFRVHLLNKLIALLKARSTLSKSNCEDDVLIQAFLKRLQFIEFELSSFQIEKSQIYSIQVVEQNRKRIGLDEHDDTTSSYSKESQQCADDLIPGSEHAKINISKIFLDKNRNFHENKEIIQASSRDIIEKEPDRIIISLNHKNAKKTPEIQNKKNNLDKNLYSKNLKEPQNDQQSVLSKKNDRSRKKIEAEFWEQISNLKFAKFLQVHLVFITYTLFVILLGATIFLSYSNGKYSADALTQRIDLVLTSSEKKVVLSQLAKNVLMDQLTNEYYVYAYPQDFIFNLNRFILNESEALLENMGTVNAKFEKQINNIKDSEITNLYNTNNIRMFYGDFDSIFTTKSYILMNNLRATNELISTYTLYFSNYNKKNYLSASMRKNAHNNLYNDYLVEYQRIEVATHGNISSLLRQILRETHTVYYCCYAFLAIYLLCLVYAGTKYYFDTVKYLGLFPNHPKSDLIRKIDFLERLKIVIESESKREKMKTNLQLKDEKKERKTVHKTLGGRSLFGLIFLKRTIVFSTFYIPSVIMLSISFKYSGNILDYAESQIMNIDKLSRILLLSFMNYHVTTLNMMNLNTFVIQNYPADLVLDRFLEEMKNSVSAAQYFNPEVESMLSENVCNFYSTGDGECEKALNGIGTRGLRSLIYSLYDQYSSDRDRLKNKNYTFDLVYPFLTGPINKEISELTVGGLLPAIRTFIARVGANLMKNLENNLNNIIKAFWASIVVDLVCLGGMVHLVYGNVRTERRKILNTIKFVPMDFVLRNMNLKAYLMGERKEFVKILKDAEMINPEKLEAEI